MQRAARRRILRVQVVEIVQVVAPQLRQRRVVPGAGAQFVGLVQERRSARPSSQARLAPRRERPRARAGLATRGAGREVRRRANQPEPQPPVDLDRLQMADRVPVTQDDVRAPIPQAIFAVAPRVLIAGTILECRRSGPSANCRRSRRQICGQRNGCHAPDQAVPVQLANDWCRCASATSSPASQYDHRLHRRPPASSTVTCVHRRAGLAQRPIHRPARNHEEPRQDPSLECQELTRHFAHHPRSTSDFCARSMSSRCRLMLFLYHAVQRHPSLLLDRSNGPGHTRVQADHRVLTRLAASNIARDTSGKRRLSNGPNPLSGTACRSNSRSPCTSTCIVDHGRIRADCLGRAPSRCRCFLSGENGNEPCPILVTDVADQLRMPTM
jgi:hypothetical protein